MVVTAYALEMLSSDIFLLNSVASCLPTIAFTLDSKVKKVVVLMPPPVDPGEAPIHIRHMTTMSVRWLSNPVSTLLKPAVLDVTERNNDSSHEREDVA